METTNCSSYLSVSIRMTEGAQYDHVLLVLIANKVILSSEWLSVREPMRLQCSNGVLSQPFDTVSDARSLFECVLAGSPLAVLLVS
jgi:hypothetical protein